MNPRHKAFADEYLRNGMNGTKAYLKAYPDSTPKTARTNASELLTNTGILEYINEKIRKASDKAQIDFEKAIRMHEEIALLYQFVQPNYAQNSLAELAKLKGWYAPAKTEGSIKYFFESDLDD